MNKKDTYGVIILIILYFYQGLILGLPGGGIQIILAEKEFPFSAIGMFSFCALPFTFKFFWSPFLDYYYVQRFGKRKIYIIPCILLTAGLFIQLSSKIEQLIADKDASTLFNYFFLTVLLLATMDTAIDGWALTLVSTENVGVCSACQNFGQQVGWFFSLYIFTLLNSVTFSNQYLNVVYSEEPFLKLSSYLNLLAFIGLGLVVWLIVGTTETNPEENYEIRSFWDEVALISGLWRNKYLKMLCIILFIKRIGLGTMETVGPVFLVKNGFPKETLSKISIAAFPFVVSVPLCVGRFATGRRRENRTLMVTIGWACVNMALFAYAIYKFTHNDQNNAVIIIAFNLFAQEAIKRVFYTVSFAFVFEISEAQVGAIQVSALGSLSNFSRVFLDPLWVSLLDFIPYHIILVAGILQQIWFVKKYGRRYIQMQYLPKEVWNLKNDHYIELQG